MWNKDESWLFRPLFDFEFKSYQVLGYVQRLERQFEAKKLFPYVEDLRKHLNLLHEFKAEKERVEGKFRGKIEEIDLDKLSITRAFPGDNEDLWNEIEAIMDFAEKSLHISYSRATELLDKLEKEVLIRPVGIIHESMPSGFLFLKNRLNTRVYSYDFRFIHQPESSRKDIRTHYIDEFYTGYAPNYGDIKWKYIKSDKVKYGTNAWLVETNSEIPLFETLLPIVKNYLVIQGS